MEDEKVEQFFGVWVCNLKMIFMVEEFVKQPSPTPHAPPQNGIFFFKICTLLKRKHNVD
jgi:hypothetical protein